jgi:hypothetical protein
MPPGGRRSPCCCLEEVRELATAIGDESNTFTAMEKLFIEYQTRPSFGSSDQVLLSGLA